MAKRKNKNLNFSPQCFTLRLEVFPPIAMGKENALKLATSLAVHQDLTDIHMGDESWTFRRPQVKGHSRGYVQVTVEDQEITIEHQSPNVGLERFEILVDKTLDAVSESTITQAVFGVIVTLEYIVNIGSDARKAILGAMGMFGEAAEGSGEDDKGKLGTFERPCHFVGLRLGFPPYKYMPEETDEETKVENGGKKPDSGTVMDSLIEKRDDSVEAEEEIPEGENWQATLTLQSLQDDSDSLSVEVSGRWIGPIEWGDSSKEFVSSCLNQVDEFLKTRTNRFLQQFGSEE